MSIVFYGAPMSSATPVAWALAELGVAHEKVVIDLASGAQRKPEFLRLNPNGKVPTLVVDGTPMFEALAIQQWLGDRYGVEKGLWPASDAPARLRALSWGTWAYVTVGAALSRLFFATGERFGADFRNEAQVAYARNEIDGLLGLLDAQFEASPYLLGDSFSLADLTVASTLGYAASTGVSLAGHATLRGWLERCQARPAMAAVMGK